LIQKVKKKGKNGASFFFISYLLGAKAKEMLEFYLLLSETIKKLQN